MSRAALFTSAVLAAGLATTPAATGGELPSYPAYDLQWNACAGDAGGAADITLPCSDENAVASLMVTLSIPTQLSDFAAIEAAFIIAVDAPVLPPFFNFQNPLTNPLGCNPGLSVGVEKPDPSCSQSADPWSSPAALFGYEPSYSGSAYRGRLLLYVHHPTTTPTRLEPATRYFGFTVDFAIGPALDEGCGGCTTPVTIGLNEAKLVSVVPAPIYLQPGPSGACVTAGGGGRSCSDTPARDATWGRLKSLYR